MERQFQTARHDGRSDGQVIYDLVKDSPPETTFQYAQIEDALQAGMPVKIDRARVYRAARAGGRMLLARDKRGLQVVRGLGYRVLRSDEHLTVALRHEDAGRRKYLTGMYVLKNTRTDELTEAQRNLHQGHLLIVQGLSQAIDAVRRRQDRQEAAIRSILQRIGAGDDPLSAVG